MGEVVNAFLSEEVTVMLAPGDNWMEKLELSTKIESKFALPLTTRL